MRATSWGEIPKIYKGIVEFHDGSKIWVVDRKWHREDGPAFESSTGTKCWYFNGKHLFRLSHMSQPFILLEEFMDEEGKKQIKVLNQQGIKIWPNLPGLKELAENWEKELK
jgi:hypothetical protein